MGFYSRYIVPRMNDKMASGPVADQYRKQVLAPAKGRVLDIGFGTGLNAPHYPGTVEHVTGIDVNPGTQSLARKRVAQAKVPIELSLTSGERLPFEDASFDTVVTTLSLCSIPDVASALAEIRRVLVAGGMYLFMEHGLSDDPGVRKWQRRLNPIQRVVADGCNLDRDIRSLIEGGGFRFEAIEQFYYPKAPRPMGFTTLGRAAIAKS